MAVRGDRAARPGRRLARRGRLARVLGRDGHGRRAGDAEHVSRDPDADVDGEHRGRCRADAAAGRSRRGEGPRAGDRLPRHHGLHPADAGARRRGCGRAGGTARPARPADLGRLRRPAGEVPGRRRHVRVPRTRPRGPRGAGDGRRRPGGRPTARPRRDRRRPRDLPGGRLLRPDREPGCADLRFRPTGRGPRQQRRRRCCATPRRAVRGGGAGRVEGGFRSRPAPFGAAVAGSS